MSRRLSSPALIGREAELNQVIEALDRVEVGCRCITLVGEAGIGKSRLIGEASKQARDRGVAVAAGACVDLAGGGAPFGPIREAFSQLTPCGDLFSAGAEDEAAPDPARRQRLFKEVVTCLGSAAVGRPLLLVVEDLQWSDQSTRDLLAFLAGRSGLSVLILLSVRSEHLTVADDIGLFLAELEQRGAGERIQLAPLTPNEVVELVRALLRREPGGELLEPIQRRSEGNPFFVEELVAAAAAGGESVLPPTVAEALLARAAELGPETEALLRLAAVGGRKVSHRLLEAVSGLAAERLEAVLRPAIRRQLLRAEAGRVDDAYAFRHALVQETLYRDLLPSERARLHGRYSAAVAADSSLFDDPVLTAVETAHHRERAHDLAGARRAWIEAAEGAYRALAFPEADAHFARAIEIGDRDQRPEGEARLLERASQAARAAGTPPRAVGLLREAIAALGNRDLSRRIHLWQQLASSLWETGDLTEAERASEEAVRLAEPLPVSAAKAHALASLASVDLVLGLNHRALERGRAAYELAEAVESYEEMAFALLVTGPARTVLGDEEAGVDEARRAWEMGRGADTFDQLVAGMHYLECVDVARGPAAALAVGQELLAKARRQGVPDLLSNLLASIGGIHYRLGRWREARACFEEAAQGLVTLPAIAVLSSRRSMLAAATGRFDEARALAGRAQEIVGDTHELGYAFSVQCAVAHLAVCEDDPPAVLAAVERGLAAALPGAQDPAQGPPLLLLGLQAAADISETSRARRSTRSYDTVAGAQEAAARFAGQLHELIPEQAVSPQRQLWRALGQAEWARAHGDDTTDQWAAVVEQAGRGQLVPDRAYGLLRLAGAAARDPAPRRRPATALAEAHRTASELGAAPLRKRIETLARRARLPLSTEVSTTARSAGGLDHLSARELEVLTLVAGGQSNRQIAESLFITEKTAGAHVSSILAKLGAANRGEAAVMAVREGLIER